MSRTPSGLLPNSWARNSSSVLDEKDGSRLSHLITAFWIFSSEKRGCFPRRFLGIERNGRDAVPVFSGQPLVSDKRLCEWKRSILNILSTRGIFILSGGIGSFDSLISRRNIRMILWVWTAPRTPKITTTMTVMVSENKAGSLPREFWKNRYTQ